MDQRRSTPRRWGREREWRLVRHARPHIPVNVLLITIHLLLAALHPSPTRAADLSVTINHYTFDPAMLTIAPGTTIRWINYQTDANTVTALDGPELFRSPLLRAGESFDYTFTAPGTYRYTSSPHPFMSGEVRVVPDEQVTFPETGVLVEGAFLRYWRDHGLDLGDPGISARESLALFGYPLAEPFMQTLENGKTYRVQYFERARFEFHPENRQPYDILLGQFGRWIHPPDPPTAPRPGADYFPATGHNLGGRFREFWLANGGLAVFGLPLTEEVEERLEDGNIYRVQYFERARLEYHPENPVPYDVLLGQFGRIALGDR